MTEPGRDAGARTGGSLLGRVLGWLRGSVSWGAILVTMFALGAAMAIFIVIGGVDVSADKPDGWLVSHALHFVFKRSEGSRSGGVTQPYDIASPYRVRLAAQHFDMVCANCHGRPGSGQSVVALSMNPRPQYLPNVVGQFTNAELYVIVEHGVKYSAMPSWPTDTRGDEVWSMVAFLRQLPTLNAQSYHEMTALPAGQAPASLAGGDDTALRPANARQNTPPKNEFQYAAPSSGFADQTIRDNPVATCARCHGADGSGAVTGGEAPNLTLQNAAYLSAALQAYTSGARKSGFMQNIAAQLTSAQITALSNYYAGLSAPIPVSPAPDPALVQRGETIATQGVPESATPACANCHESRGSTITGAPHLAGQNATYLRRQLTAMGRGGRGGAAIWNPMFDVAHDLSDRDVVALAAYYSSLRPSKTAQGSPGTPPTMAVAVAGDTGAAKTIFATRCMKCHVNGGRGDLQGNFPNLTIQNATYVAQNLYAFRARARLNDKMQEVADSLSFDEMKSLAAYVNGLAPQPALAKPDSAAAARGAVIATKGAVDRGVPACLDCHGAAGVSALPLIPPLQGQSVAYLRNRLENFSKPYPQTRAALNPMPAIARKLTDQECADLAAYFAAAPPLQKVVGRP